MRVAFLGSPPFATPILGRLAASPHRPVLVVTPPDRPQGRGRKRSASPLAERAEALGIALLRPASTREAGFVAALRALAPDVLLVASYGEILRRNVLELAPHGALNVHASLLPRHRGASPVQAAILAGDADTGVCVQRMVLALDEGDVLVERRTPIGEHETAGELLERLAELGAEAAVDALDRLEAGRATFTPQDPGRATYARKIRKEEAWIDWSADAATIARRVRAYQPWPGARARLAAAPERDGEPEVEIVLLAVRGRPDEDAGERVAPGTLLDSRGRLLVAAGRGAVEVLRLKPAGRAAMDAGEFLRGARLAPSARFVAAPTG